MTFSGTALFSKDPQGVVYAEKGEMLVDGSAPLPAARTYFWRDGGAGYIDVLFDDERPFHRFSLEDQPEASHFCDPDTYDVVYDFGAWPEWSCVWTVKGPRKDYRMDAHYTRDA